MRTGKDRWTGSLILGLLAGVAAGPLALTSLVERWEQYTYDQRLMLRGRRPTRARIVIAAISDETLEQWSDAMVFWGRHHAAAINQARRCGAAWIGLDFIQGISGGEAGDQAFALALHGGRVVLSQRLQSAMPIDALLYAHADQPANLGFIDAVAELDEVVRRAAVYAREGERLVPSFPAVLALRLRGQSPLDEQALRSLAGAPKRQNQIGTVWINYTGPPESFPYVPIERLAEDRLSETERGLLKGAVVLIGPTYDGANDQHRGSGGLYYHGVEINAHALATLVDGRALQRAPIAWEAALSSLIGALVAVALALLPIGWGVTLAVAAAGAWWWAAVRAYAGDMLWPVAGPLLATGLAGTTHYTARAVEEVRRRRQIHRVFGRYVTPAIVEHLLHHPSHLQLGGDEHDVSILFVDTRGHTTAAQRSKPAAVMADLNELFGEIVPVIQRHAGLIYGFRGDGFLAVFGAPRPLTSHAQAAVDAAIEVVRVTRALSARRVQAGRAPVRIGCGVHSGPAVCGNLGGGDRTEFTVIGDTVNSAARLDELNKHPDLNAETPSEIVISEETYSRLQHQPPVRGPFEFTIRGREGLTRVYGVEVNNDDVHGS